MNKNWMLWAGLILILVVFILVWQFAPAIQRWLANVFIDIIVLVLTFAAGWLLGRFGGKRNRSDNEKNARTSPRRRNSEAETAHLTLPERHFHVRRAR